MKIFVFDLDFTLWNAGDTFCSETTPPYTWENGQLFDQRKRWIRLYPDTVKILEYLQSENKIVVAASRTHRPDWANKLLELFDIDKYFNHKEIYSGSKITHLQKIKEAFDVSYNQIIFFDDEERNILDVSQLGIKCIHITNGINHNHIAQVI